MRVHERILSYNAGRDAELVVRKYARMAQNPFVFLRGSCHLFYADWKGGSELDAAPLTWISGDLHLENFGSYKGDNRLAYFDLKRFRRGCACAVHLGSGAVPDQYPGRCT